MATWVMDINSAPSHIMILDLFMALSANREHGHQHGLRCEPQPSLTPLTVTYSQYTYPQFVFSFHLPAFSS